MDLNKNYITVQGWMANDLNLSGNDLLIYALIYGFSQNGSTSKFTGSLSYIEDLLNIARTSVSRSLNKLVDRGLIIKKVDGKTGTNNTSYVINDKILVQNETSSILHTSSETLPVTSSETLPVYTNINNNINNTKKNKKKSKSKIDMVLAKMSEYDFSEKVQDLIVDFYEDKLEQNQKLATKQIEFTLDELATATTEEQIVALTKAIKGNWKTVYLDKNNNDIKGSYHLEGETSKLSVDDRNEIAKEGLDKTVIF